MEGTSSTLGAAQLARLLGPWRVVGDSGRHPARQVLAERIRSLILDGRIAAGTRLPAERPLSETLQLSRTTITAAYALLVEQGYAAARRGSGTFTALPERLLARSMGGYRFEDDPDMLDLSRRVSVILDGDDRGRFATGLVINVKLKDGTVLEADAAHAHGEPEWPLTDGEIRDKFLNIAGPVLGADAKNVAESIENIAEQPQVSHIARMLAE